MNFDDLHLDFNIYTWVWAIVMVFNATFNNISVIT